MHDVWVTGAGIVTALGSGLKAHTDAVMQAKTGLARHTFFGGTPPDPVLCGKIPSAVIGADIEESAPNRANTILEQALEQSLHSAALTLPLHADIIVGTTLGNMHGGTSYYKKIKQKENPDISLIKHFLPCAPVSSVKKKYNITGKNWTVASACGSASAAIGHAFRKIREGACDRVIAGGFEALSPFVIAGFNSLQLISKNESKPFDLHRDGLNPGEGAALLILESKEAAQARNVSSLASISGFGDAHDAYHHTTAHPEGVGLVSAVTGAFNEAGISPEDIDHIHLHGTGTKINDTSEYNALKKVFGDHLPQVPVCSTKPMTGHTFGASGALNAVFSLISITTGTIPATLFHKTPDPDLSDLSVSATVQKKEKIDTVLSTSLGFGGEAFALIISKAAE